MVQQETLIQLQASHNGQEAPQEPPQTFPKPPETLPKSSPKPPKINPRGLLETNLDHGLKKLDFERPKNGQEAPKSARETPQTVSNPSQLVPKPFPNLSEIDKKRNRKKHRLGNRFFTMFLDFDLKLHQFCHRCSMRASDQV